MLAKAVRSLGTAGQPVAASRLAARAWWVLNESHPREAEHINGVLHFLARLPDEPPTRRETSVPTDTVLDVRSHAPAQRHTLIFGTYGELEPGSGFVLVNDHDPKPLYYQLEAEHTGDFTWDYLEEGPEVWRVRIGRPAA